MQQDISLLIFQLKPSFTLSNYERYCGKGNDNRNGKVLKPNDDIDACCKVHDECYGDLSVSLCAKTSPIIGFLLQQHGCGTDLLHSSSSIMWKKYHFKVDGDGSIKCYECWPDYYEECRCYLCICDAMLAFCLHKTRASYQNNLKI